jgi:ribosomal protein S18 acetylase RimI-like enzyme
MESEKRFVYRGNKLPDPCINPVIYKPEFFQMELDLESELLYESRKKNGILPYKINESNDKEIAEFRSFFYKNRNTFYFLFDNNVHIGSILFLRNYIQSLIIASSYQRKGYGTKLAVFAINKIFDSGYDFVELNTLPGNIGAEQLYKKIGFIELEP